VFVSFANSGFKIVITAKIKTVNKKKGGRQVCGFCDKQDSKGSQLYKKRRRWEACLLRPRKRSRREACSSQTKKKITQRKRILQEIILEIKYKKQNLHYFITSELQNNCLPHIITWFQFYNKLEETTQRGERPSKIRSFG
jgi:hypothetical protein